MTMKLRIIQAIATAERDILSPEDDRNQVSVDPRIMAERILEAMRVPTAWMIDEMCGEWVRRPGDFRKFGEKMVACWQASINAALSDEPGNPETQAMIDAAQEPQ